MNNNTRNTVISSLFWKLLERIGVQGIQLIITLVLARMLMPSDYGIIALLSIFITLSNTIVQRGFTSALIQRKDVDEVDFSTVFIISLMGSLLLYIILFFSAPLIAEFYNYPELSITLRVLALSLPFSAANSVQIAIVSRAMQFRKLFLSSIGSIVCSGSAGILLAFFDYGLWALIAQQISFSIINCFFMAMVVKWRPKLLFSIKKAAGLFSYGWKMLLTSLIDTLYVDLNTIIIGKIFSTQMLGFYNKGKQFPSMLVTSLNGSIQAVMFSAFSRHQDDRLYLKNMMRRSIVTSSFIIFPIMAGLAATADSLVELILTDKWLDSVPFIQLFCAYFALYPIHTSNLQAISAIGRSDLYLKLEIIKKIIGIIILIISIPHGIYAIAIGGIATGVIGAVINMYPNIKLLQYPIQEQLFDILPSLFLSITMGLLVYSILFLKFPVVITIILQVLVGTLFYLGLAKLLKFECLTYILKVFESKFKRSFDK
ncbi:membrane protein involved in the export of O-antigen and teichoic acid [Schinkia azotoformans MEV2011]|uniref:Membrane protein involved in the export of O-antigen and teichoic acid n=1 Tax=Schinkia azotoformans MEV2011 TaxID=1348973 RepID=A0A072NMG8_SCHAZ|nr:lipopolysaccharide biosynthesis protein [Schinkia azotoformans]KEF38879.1 membrane protein involved in the export of O-antigen and teichoic acid [Schinkia azotoformans MEV2011]MEC1696782.1 lipopolysaccharide biosynthesis protein [Schinkia azotoformans]MEC1725009.1 lipopolysaccharide biosynthesis protein [Schinkia azotoformans]MEC1741756.1 lipopolysaccharide biosynthesis protein [Schinkia azotoformans]MEC1766566.1 lipopolysaccharide biosynthesis protein [Schinkia azotoformans]